MSRKEEKEKESRRDGERVSRENERERDISKGGKEKERVECRKQKSSMQEQWLQLERQKEKLSESLCKYEAERSLGKKIVDIKKFLLTKSSNVCLLDRNVFKEISAA